MGREKAWPFCVLLSLQFAVQPYLLRTYTSDALNKCSYVAAGEMLKLIACLAVLIATGNWQTAFQNWTWKRGIREAWLPSLAYALHNIANTFAAQKLDPVSYNILNQTKLLFIALLVCRKQNHLCTREWVGLGMILAASFLTAGFDDRDEPTSTLNIDRYLGVASAICAAIMSALGTVLTEEVLNKGRNPFLLSAELAVGGIAGIAPGIALCLISPLNDVHPDKTWGWTAATSIPLITHAGGGILVGVVTKAVGSLNKAIITVVSLLLTGFLKAVVECRCPSAICLVSIFLVAAGLVVYKHKLDTDNCFRRGVTTLGRSAQTCATLLVRSKQKLPLGAGDAFAWAQEYAA
mmetsp:Transcript_65180/g.153466  ORF Transcript_65180/g.153466 Transcript_65180/m.153466 type:complete len:350 (+) Transcript_65180:12-1061(+)